MEELKTSLRVQDFLFEMKVFPMMIWKWKKQDFGWKNEAFEKSALESKQWYCSGSSKITQHQSKKSHYSINKVTTTKTI